MAIMDRTKRRNREGKGKRKPVSLAPSTWDHGATGWANRQGLVHEERGDINPATGKIINPNGVTGVRRVDMLEIYYRREWISPNGYNAGERLRDAWEAIQRGPGWLDNDRVQSSPKPDHAVEIQIDRISALVWISRRVPREHAPLIEHIALLNGSIGGVKVKGKTIYKGRAHDDGKVALRVAFDALAAAIGS